MEAITMALKFEQVLEPKAMSVLFTTYTPYGAERQMKIVQNSNYKKCTYDS